MLNLYPINAARSEVFSEIILPDGDGRDVKEVLNRYLNDLLHALLHTDARQYLAIIEEANELLVYGGKGPANKNIVAHCLLDAWLMTCMLRMLDYANLIGSSGINFMSEIFDARTYGGYFAMLQEQPAQSVESHWKQMLERDINILVDSDDPKCRKSAIKLTIFLTRIDAAGFLGQAELDKDELKRTLAKQGVAVVTSREELNSFASIASGSKTSSVPDVKLDSKTPLNLIKKAPFLYNSVKFRKKGKKGAKADWLNHCLNQLARTVYDLDAVEYLRLLEDTADKLKFIVEEGKQQFDDRTMRNQIKLLLFDAPMTTSGLKMVDIVVIYADAATDFLAAIRKNDLFLDYAEKEFERGRIHLSPGDFTAMLNDLKILRESGVDNAVANISYLMGTELKKVTRERDAAVAAADLLSESDAASSRKKKSQVNSPKESAEVKRLKEYVAQLQDKIKKLEGDIALQQQQHQECVDQYERQVENLGETLNSELSLREANNSLVRNHDDLSREIDQLRAKCEGFRGRVQEVNGECKQRRQENERLLREMGILSDRLGEARDAVTAKTHAVSELRKEVAKLKTNLREYEEPEELAYATAMSVLGD